MSSLLEQLPNTLLNLVNTPAQIIHRTRALRLLKRGPHHFTEEALATISGRALASSGQPTKEAPHVASVVCTHPDSLCNPDAREDLSDGKSVNGN